MSTTTPITILIVSDDSTGVGDLVEMINERLGDRVAVDEIYRDYHFYTESVDIMMSNGLCKTRRDDRSYHIYFPLPRLAAMKERIPFISIAIASLTKLRLFINRKFDGRSTYSKETLQIERAALAAVNQKVVAKLEKRVIQLEKRRNKLSPATV